MPSSLEARMALPFDEFPPELILEIAEYLRICPDVQNLAATCKLFFDCCIPLLHEVVVLESARWQELERCISRSRTKRFPSWCHHVRLLRNSSHRQGPPLNFHEMLPILEHLPRLREIDLTRSYAQLAPESGIEKICERLPSLKALKCTTFIDIDQTAQISLSALTEITLSLESEHGKQEMDRQMQDAFLMSMAQGMGNVAWAPANVAPYQIPSGSPFAMLSTLSVSNPRLQKLALWLNYPMRSMGARSLPPATTEPLLSNTFPHLTEFSLNGLLQPPAPHILSTFLSSHSKLQSLTCYLFVPDLILPYDIFPNLEYFEGHAALLATICETSETPHAKITKIKVGDGEDVTPHMLQAFPKLPKLADVYVKFGYKEKVTPSFVRVLGESCPDLKTLSLRDTSWFGGRAEFSLAFQFFPSLEDLSTGSQFGFYGQSTERQRDAPRIPPEDILPIIFARSAPRLTTMTVGDESHGCVVTVPRSLRVERNQTGTHVIEIKSGRGRW